MSDKSKTIGDLEEWVRDWIKELIRESEHLTNRKTELQTAKHQAMIGHFEGWKSITDIEDEIVINTKLSKIKMVKFETLELVLEKIGEVRKNAKKIYECSNCGRISWSNDEIKNHLIVDCEGAKIIEHEVLGDGKSG